MAKVIKVPYTMTLKITELKMSPKMYMLHNRTCQIVTKTNFSHHLLVAEGHQTYVCTYIFQHMYICMYIYKEILLSVLHLVISSFCSENTYLYLLTQNFYNAKLRAYAKVFVANSWPKLFTTWKKNSIEAYHKIHSKTNKRRSTNTYLL